VQDGTHGDQCPQGIPIWRRKQTGTANTISTGSEDCLFLDVNVPRTVWEKRNVGRGAPVLVRIYGGGYTAGSKWQFGSGAGLLKQAASHIIYVALNYRVSLAGSLSSLRPLLFIWVKLGIYGFLSGRHILRKAALRTWACSTNVLNLNGCKITSRHLEVTRHV
jgi:hypothetical protein